MKTIGDVLGHHSFFGTSAYLRLDVAMLRGVALEIPQRVGGVMRKQPRCTASMRRKGVHLEPARPRARHPGRRVRSAALRSYLARAGYSDLDAEGFERWRRRLRHAAHNTQVDWAMMVYRFCRYRRRRESHCFLPQRSTLGRHRPYRCPRRSRRIRSGV